MNNLAILLTHVGRLDEAEALLQETGTGLRGTDAAAPPRPTDTPFCLPACLPRRLCVPGDPHRHRHYNYHRHGHRHGQW